jgi:hypothetical protein
LKIDSALTHAPSIVIDEGRMSTGGCGIHHTPWLKDKPTARNASDDDGFTSGPGTI